MSEEELIEKLSNYLKDSLGKDLIKALKTTLDKLQKDNYNLDRENQHFFDRMQDLQKENTELKERIKNQYELINEFEKCVAPKVAQKIFRKNLENKKEVDNSISKDIIRDKIKELEEDEEFYREQSRMYEFEGKMKMLEELLGESNE